MRSLGRLAAAGPRVWVVPGFVVAAGVLLWLAIRSPDRSTGGGVQSAATAAATAKRAPNPMNYVVTRADTRNAANVAELIAAYGAWASRPDAADARRAIVKAFVSHDNLQVGVEALLSAVDQDTTPRERDPMWPELVASVGRLWDAVTFRYGRDLAFLETRSKPKDLVIESLAAIPAERLADEQRPLLASDFIDIYATLRPGQKPAIDRALAALAGKDVVEIMGGRGLAEGNKQLDLVVERDRELEKVRRHPVKERPAEE